MSLKGFHIVFIAVSVLLTLGFWLWSLSVPAMELDPLVRVLGYASGASSALLLAYGIWFLRKARKIIV